MRRGLAAAVTGAVTAGTAVTVATGPSPASPWSTAVPTPVAVLSAVAPAPDAERHGGASTSPLPHLSSEVQEAHPYSPVDNLLKATGIADRTRMRAAVLRAARADGAREVALRDDGVFVGPTVGRLTSAAGPRWGGRHEGADIANRVGTPIYAVTDGVVVDSGPASGFGLWVRLAHPGGWTSVYGHIDRGLVEVGQRVRAGQKIALMGNRGQSTGPHLHLEVWDGAGRKVDPVAWLSARGVRSP